MPLEISCLSKTLLANVLLVMNEQTTIGKVEAIAYSQDPVSSNTNIIAEIPAKINLDDGEDTNFYKEMADRKFDMKLDKEDKDKQMEMPMEAPASVAGLMARGEQNGNI